MQYSIDKSLNGLTTKPLQIHRGISSIGTVRGYFDNLFQRMFDELTAKRSLPLFMKYEIKDELDQVRLTSKMEGILKPKLFVNYIDSNNVDHVIQLENMKDRSLGKKNAEFTYKSTRGYIVSTPQKNLMTTIAEMFLGEQLIASWSYDIKEKSIKINIYETFEDELLIIGLFHVFLYPNKG